MMCHLRRTAIAFCLLATLACQHSGHHASNGDESGGPASSDPAATIDGRTITIGELDEYVKEQLFSEATSERNPAALYEARSRFVDEMINELAVEKAASAADLSIEDYLIQQVAAEGEVPEEEIAAFYEENLSRMGGRSLDELRDRISVHLEQQRIETIIGNIRDQSGAEILLEPARIEVEAIGPSKGPDDAVVTIIEFSDFECPYCKNVVPTIEQIVAKYPTQVRFVFRNLPLNNIHARAQPAAEAAACANNQGKFWGFHDLVFANSRALTDEDLARYASEVGLEMDAFQQCVQDRETQQIVEADLATAERLQISGTPSFLINGIPMHGAQSVEALSEVIDAEIARISTDGSQATR